MEEDADGEDLTPFWLQSTNNTRRADRLRRRVSSLFFSSGVVVFFLLVTATFFLVFILPSTISFSAQIFRPNNVKKSWDSLNIVLVLVAVVFGFLSRIKNEEKYDEFQPSPNKQNETQKPKSSNSDWYNYNNTIEGQKTSTSYSNSAQWYEHSDYQMKLENKDSILRRNSSSYPDLPEFSSNRWDYVDYQRRFINDDLHVDSGRVPDPVPVKLHHRRHRSVEEIDSFRAMPKTKTIFVDTLVGRSKEATHFSPASSPPPPTTDQPPGPPEYERVDRRKKRLSTKRKKDSEPMNPITELTPPLPPQTENPPASPVAKSPEFQEMPKRSHESVRRSKARPSRKLNKDLHSATHNTTPPPPQPHSPPPPPPPLQGKSSKSATKDFLNSLYHKKKKKPRQKSVDNLDSLIHQAQQPISIQLPPPTAPVPPPPPPPTAFQNLFLSKKQTRKRTISVTFPPPPPPPPPPRTTAREPNHNSQISQLPSQRPPNAGKMKIFDKFEENLNSGESPLNRIPPPPPPPPPFFKNPAWKFVVQGDYVRVNSSNSSRSGSPDINDVDSDVTPSADEGAVTPFHPSPLFCQSPDVNTKAENFISSFRAKLKLEKAHSMNGRQLGLSGLGPGSGPSQI